MPRSADRKILTEQAYSAQRSYGVSGARRVARRCWRVYVMANGKIIASGTAALARPRGWRLQFCL
jgi:hypothetical protein